MINSTLWFERIAREIFITALLMAEPYETEKELPQIEIRSLDYTGWSVPPGRYGFVPAASVGIIRRAMLNENEKEIGLDALESLGKPEAASRTSDYDGRRLVRVDGGFIVLNFQKYRDRDYTAAKRAKRYRDNKKRHAVTSTRHAVSTTNVTQAEGEGEAEGVPKQIESVLEYAKEIGLSKFEAEKFFDFFTSNGWKVSGRSAMKDWKASLRNWKRNQKNGAPPTKADYKRNYLPPAKELSDEEFEAQRKVALEECAKAKAAIKP